jgi:hypothetical protein
MRSRKKQDKLVKFMVMSARLNLNDDSDCPINRCGHLTKSYYNGTHLLNQRFERLGARLNIETGYEEKKLE